VPDFAEVHDAHMRSLLEPGEQLLGVCVATQQSTFSGRAVALAVTDRRLLVQPLDRRGRPKGDALKLPPGKIASASAGGAGGGWANVGMAILDQAAVKLELRTAGGEKLKLTSRNTPPSCWVTIRTAWTWAMGGGLHTPGATNA